MNFDRNTRRFWHTIILRNDPPEANHHAIYPIGFVQMNRSVTCSVFRLYDIYSTVVFDVYDRSNDGLFIGFSCISATA